MANYEWLGDGGTNLATTSTCWTPTGVPTTGDVVIFNSKAGTNNCNFNLTNASPTLTVDEIIIEDDFNATVLLQTVPVIKGLFLNGFLKPSAASNIEFRHGASPNFFGSYKTYDSKFILIGDNANYNSGTITMSMYGSTVTKFDDGNHNETILNSGSFEPNYSTPTGTSGKTTFDALTINSGVTFAPSTALTSSDRNKHFVIDNFTCNIDLFNGGEAIYQFKASSGGFNLPVRGASGYGSTPSATPTLFDSYFRKIILTADTAGHKVVMDDNTYIALEELEINDGVMLLGPTGTGVQGSDIRLVNAPKVRGSWSFSEITSGIYRSPRTAEGPNAKVYGAFYITGKLTVDGLIDPTGMVFTPQVANPESTNPQDTIWIKNEDGHLYRGDRDVESTVHFNVRNDEGSTIPLGAPLYSKGEIGGSNRIKVGIADASDPAKMPAIGLAMEEMNTSSTQDGNMILTGILNSNITITGVSEQDIIYVAPHGGTAPYLTITRPTSGSHLVQNVGVCVRQASANVSQGMKVSAIGRTNDIPNAVITTDSADADYVYIDDGNTFKKITPSDLGIGGGGGSGTVTSVAVSGSDGIEVDSGSPITTSGTIALGVDAPTLRSHINVEDGADVTDTANVTAAGALMDSEVTNLAEVKAFSSSDYATAAQGVLADSAQQPPSEGAFVDGDKTKLDGIEALADVTDTANVTAAGALMDSEVTNLADVKAFDPTDYATAAQGVLADSALQVDATGTYGVWKSTTDYDNKAEATDHLFLTDDTTNFTRTGTLTGFSSGVFTATASTAGTYMVRVQYQFGPASSSSIGEVSGNKYTLQALAYKNTSTLVGFGRLQTNGFWADTHFDSSYIVTLANGDTLENKYKIVDHNASGTQFKLKSGGGSNPATIMEMVKIA